MHPGARLGSVPGGGPEGRSLPDEVMEKQGNGGLRDRDQERSSERRCRAQSGRCHASLPPGATAACSLRQWGYT